jgi:hypothetical protein
MTTVSTPRGSYLLKSVTYTVPSSQAGQPPYTVSVDPATKLMHCTCPARRQCWHQKAVAAGMAGKPRLRIQPIPPAPAPFVRPPLSAAARDAVAALYGAD